MQRAISESNNLADIEAFVNKNLLNSAEEQDDFFCFGAKFGKGSDENNFQLAIIIYYNNLIEN